MKLADIIILGVNGNCLDIADAIGLLGGRVVGYLDDDPAAQALGKISDAPKFSNAHFVNGIGSPKSYKLKPQIVASTKIPADRWATIVHPAATVSPQSRLGHGTVVLANSVVGARAVIGNHVMILQNSVVSHDTTIGDYTAIATGVCLSGKVTVGSNCYLGSNCAIRDGLTIGDRALVGLGAVVTKNVAADSVVVGNPARPYRQ